MRDAFICSYAEIQVFGQVLSGICKIHKKWVRDRMGAHPPMTTDEFRFNKIEIVRGKT